MNTNIVKSHYSKSSVKSQKIVDKMVAYYRKMHETPADMTYGQVVKAVETCMNCYYASCESPLRLDLSDFHNDS